MTGTKHRPPEDRCPVMVARRHGGSAFERRCTGTPMLDTVPPGGNPNVCSQHQRNYNKLRRKVYNKEYYEISA